MSSRDAQQHEIRSLLDDADATAEQGPPDKAGINADTIVNYGTIIMGPADGVHIEGPKNAGCSAFEESVNASNPGRDHSQFNCPCSSNRREFSNQERSDPESPGQRAGEADQGGGDPFAALMMARYMQMQGIEISACLALSYAQRQIAGNACNAMAAALLLTLTARQLLSRTTRQANVSTAAHATPYESPMQGRPASFGPTNSGKISVLPAFSNPMSPHTRCSLAMSVLVSARGDRKPGIKRPCCG